MQTEVKESTGKEAQIQAELQCPCLLQEELATGLEKGSISPPWWPSSCRWATWRTGWEYGAATRCGVRVLSPDRHWAVNGTPRNRRFEDINSIPQLELPEGEKNLL